MSLSFRNFFENMAFWRQCRRYGIKLWHCPAFLFVLMGFLIIFSMVGSFLFAGRYFEEPEIVALVVIGITVVLLAVGNAVISGFNKMAEANIMKSEFISIVSHQLRSPLAALKWSLSAILSYDGKMFDPESLGYLQNLKINNERMIRIVNNLLNADKAEMGTLKLRREPVSLAEITKKAVRDLDSYAKASNVLLSLDVEEGVVDAIGDEDRIFDVVQNLIDNAVRYIKTGGKVEIKISRKGNDILWSAKDNGVGVSKRDHKRIFGKFFRSESAMKYQTQGTGLGLFIAKAVIDGLGGQIGFSSKDGGGSVFWFLLPAASPKI